MTTYILQQKIKNDRLIIDTKLHLDCNPKEETEADSWIQAKYNFGFPLTNIQQDMLN